MNIGEAAAASGVSAKMIRYYETIGLIAPADRSAAGYRRYGPADVHRLRFVRRARDLGFGVDGIADLLALWRDEGRTSAQVKALALDQVAVLNDKIADLEAMVRALSTLATQCSGDARAECPILDDLAAADGPIGVHEAPRFGPGFIGAPRSSRDGRG